MKLVTMTSALSRRFGLKEAIKRLKEYGFDGYDCSLAVPMANGGEFSGDDWREKAQEIREYSEKIGIKCLQTHTPSRTSDIRGLSYFLDCIEEEKKAVEISGILGAEVAVVHPTSVTDAEGNYEMIYSKVLPIAKKYGIKIACENMFAWKYKPDTETVPTACGTVRDFERYIECVNDESFTICLDIGHSNLPNSESDEYMIKALGKNITALHVNDNNRWDDLHIFPYTGKINWDRVCKALAEIDYQGNFTFEVDAFFKNYPDELLPECYELLEATGRYLIKKIEEYRVK